jgi:hypothetical protein
MQPCAITGCGKWVAYGTHCAKHEPTPEPAKAKVKTQSYKHPNREHRAGVPAIDATEVRVTLRPVVGRVKPWTQLRGGTKALSDCLVTRADGTQYRIPANKRNRESHDSKPIKREYTQAELNRMRQQSLAQTKDRHDYNEQ